MRDRTEANTQAALWAESERKHNERQRRKRQLEWVDFYRRLESAHLSLAQENAAKASQLLEEEECSP